MTDDPGKQSIDSLSSKLRWPKRGILQRTLVLWLVGVILAEVVASGVTWPSVLQTFRSLSSSAAKATATASTQANATATAIATTVQANANATAQANANATATAQAQDQATAQAQDQATATAQAQGQATATAQAVASATAQAQDQATATVVAGVTATAQAQAQATAGVDQTATAGTPIYQDALTDPTNSNTMAANWDQNSHCMFMSDGYHVTKSAGIVNLHGCRESANTYSNLTISVDVRILSGHSGGVFFRVSTDVFNTYTGGYLFEIDSQGDYRISGFNGSVQPLHDWAS